MRSLRQSSVRERDARGSGIRLSQGAGGEWKSFLALDVILRSRRRQDGAEATGVPGARSRAVGRMYLGAVLPINTGHADTAETRQNVENCARLSMVWRRAPLTLAPCRGQSADRVRISTAPGHRIIHMARLLDRHLPDWRERIPPFTPQPLIHDPDL